MAGPDTATVQGVCKRLRKVNKLMHCLYQQVLSRVLFFRHER